MSGLVIEKIKALKDNYIFVLHDSSTETTAAIDPSEALPVKNFLQRRGWSLQYIFNTHHHWDHVGGNLELKNTFGCKILTSSYDLRRIDGSDGALNENSLFQFGSKYLRMFEVPGHTLGHIAIFSETDNALFCGDTLFGLGCGRLFEGTAAQMWASLKILRGLPDQTRVFCGHEYTQRNCEFALSLEPRSNELRELLTKITNSLQHNQGTVPTLLAHEKKFNPFLRADEPAFIAKLGFSKDAEPVDVFSHLRTLKDNF
jgi:hydroxyacylglutathione hydrolase